MKINIKELEDVIVGLSKMDEIIKNRYNEIEETIFVGNDKKEEVVVKMSGDFRVISIDCLNNDNLSFDKIIEAINETINKIKNSRNEVIKEVILENTREN